MSSVEFIESIVLTMKAETIKQLGKRLFDGFISANYIDLEEASPEVIAEKIGDYFDKVELSTGKTFDKLMEKYARDLDSIVGGRVEERPKAGKTDEVVPIPRAREYYDKAYGFRKNDKALGGSFVDYSRIMLCLYMAIINRETDADKIEAFDYSLSSIELEAVIGAMLVEKGGVLNKNKFEVKDPYESDRISFVIMIISYYCMKDREVMGVY